ncbi:unnamed protein product [Caenorhabditis bovis]|uniref:Uncharacterized protein n=1 Tax=Caenorhabditis bovis TaxID=2654633 RepID=A0A8S1EKZ3_9PELO|nr:unnamed protein product [Caenorhabditis bovis]
MNHHEEDPEKARVIDQIYNISSLIDQTGNYNEEYFNIFKDATKSLDKDVKMLGINMLFRYFQNYNKCEIQMVLYKLLEDPNRDVRMLIINNLPNLAKEQSCIRPVSDVLAQLLTVKDNRELIIVKTALGKVMSDHQEECIEAILSAACHENASIDDRITILKFVELKIGRSSYFKYNLKERIAGIYEELIATVAEENVEHLLSLLEVTDAFDFIQCLDAIAKRGNENVFVGMLTFNFLIIRAIRVKHCWESNTIYKLKLFNAIINIMNKANHQEFESIVMLLEYALPMVAEENFLLVNIFPDSSTRGRICPSEQLNILYGLTRSLIIYTYYHNYVIGGVSRDMLLEKYKVFKDATPAQRFQYFMLLSSFALDVPPTNLEVEFIRFVFENFWMLVPNYTKGEHECNVYRLETLLFTIFTLVLKCPGSYDAFSSIEPHWRERLEKFFKGISSASRRIKNSIPASHDPDRVQRSLSCLNNVGAKMSIAWNVQNGDLDFVKEHVTPDNVGEVHNGRTAIQIASDYGHSRIVEYLISIGADVNAVDKYGITPLLSAVWEGHKEVVKLLLSHGAKKDIKAPDGTALIDCTEEEEIRQMLTSS